MKRVTILIVLLLFLLSSCSSENMLPTYLFCNSVEKVVGIELLYNGNPEGFGTDESLFSVMRVLNDDEIAKFMKEVYALETSYSISPPLRGYGRYIAKVTYDNGDVEMLGTEHIEYIPVGKEPTGVGAYYFQDRALEELILKYTSN